MGSQGMLSSRVARLAPSIIRGMSGRKKATSIDLSLGQPARSIDDDLLTGSIERAKSEPLGYTENAGLRELRGLIASHYGFFERETADHVIVTVGSEQALYLALTACVNDGDEVLFPDPGYPAFEGVARLVGGVPVGYPVSRETGFGPRRAALEAKLTARSRVVVLNVPSNPFGAVAEPRELQAIAELCESRGLVVVSDEIYRDLYYGREKISSICEFTRSALFVSGLSKSCAMTGLRLGYLVGDAAFIKQATLAHQLMVTCAPTLSQFAAAQVFREPGRLRAHLGDYQAARDAVRVAAKDLPEDAPLFLGDGAFYAIIDVSQYAQGDPLALAMTLLEEEDVVVVPGTAFGASGDWFWRLSYAAGVEPVTQGLRRIARFLRGLRAIHSRK